MKNPFIKTCHCGKEYYSGDRKRRDCFGCVPQSEGPKFDAFYYLSSPSPTVKNERIKEGFALLFADELE